MAEVFEQTFELDAPVELVWAYLTDPHQIVGCLPGAAITKQLDARTYAGTLTMKVGLVTATYSGKVTFERVDAARRETELVGSGQDVKGKGNVALRMLSRVTPGGRGKTSVSVKSEVHLQGLLAQMGRGIIQSVAELTLRQFTTRFKTKLDEARTKYAEVVKAHAQNFAKLYAGKLAELQTRAGIEIKPDGTNTAASGADLLKYVQAVKEVAGDVAYTSAKLTLRNMAQKENLPVPEL